jgi:hypothetical protein
MTMIAMNHAQVTCNGRPIAMYDEHGLRSEDANMAPVIIPVMGDQDDFLHEEWNTWLTRANTSALGERRDQAIARVLSTGDHHAVEAMMNSLTDDESRLVADRVQHAHGHVREEMMHGLHRRWFADDAPSDFDADIPWQSTTSYDDQGNGYQVSRDWIESIAYSERIAGTV